LVLTRSGNSSNYLSLSDVNREWLEKDVPIKFQKYGIYIIQ
jgi:hypothetical protein